MQKAIANRLRRYLFWVGLLIIMVWGVGCNEEAPSASLLNATSTPDMRLMMTRYENDAAFDIIYPQEWEFYLPRQGLLIFGEPDTLNNAMPGATVTVLRVPNQDVHGTLEGEFNHYLDFGPRREGYIDQGDIRVVELNGREALAVDLDFPGDDEQELIPMKAFILGVESDSGAVYLLSGIAPAETWPEQENAIRVTMSSIEVNE